MQDLEKEVISHWAAKNVYKVVYDEKRLTVDEEKTLASREEERIDRIKRGQKYEEFEKEWVKKRPNDQTIEFYGPWPDSKYDSFSYYGHWPESEGKSS